MPLGYSPQDIQKSKKKVKRAAETRKPTNWFQRQLQQIQQRLKPQVARSVYVPPGNRQATQRARVKYNAPAQPSGMNEAARYAGRQVTARPGPGASTQDWLNYVRSVAPSAEKGSIAFNPMLPRSGEEFMNYMMQQGVRPYIQQGPPGASVSGAYTDWLLSRYGLNQYGINPYARPTTQQGQQQGGGGAGGGMGQGFYGGGGGTAPPVTFRGMAPSMPNIPNWIQLMANWRI